MKMLKGINLLIVFCQAQAQSKMNVYTPERTIAKINSEDLIVSTEPSVMPFLLKDLL